MIKRLLLTLLPTLAAGLAVSSEAGTDAYYAYAVSNPHYVRIGNTHIRAIRSLCGKRRRR